MSGRDDGVEESNEALPLLQQRMAIPARIDAEDRVQQSPAFFDEDRDISIEGTLIVVLTLIDLILPLDRLCKVTS